MTSVDDRETLSPQDSETEQARQEYEKFRTQVRNRAIEGHRDGDMDVDTLNNALKRLGLQPYLTRSYSSTCVSIRFYVRTQDDAADDAFGRLVGLRNIEAAQQAISHLISHTVGTDVAILEADPVTVDVGWPGILVEEVEHG